MSHESSHVIVRKLTQPVTFGENGKPSWPKVWHLLALPAALGFALGLIF
jgi:hypothetical protein